MKNKVFICLLALIALVSFSSCRKSEPCKFNKATKFLEVRASQWEFNNELRMYMCHFDVPELTADVYENGEVSVLREYNTGTKNAYMVALPETTYEQIALDNDDGTTSEYFFQQHIDYIFGIGYVEVFITISDYYYDDFAPGNMLFKLQMTW